MAIQTLPNTGRVGDGPRQRADGKWEVILNGRVIGTPYNTENEAQWYYESRAGLGQGQERALSQDGDGVVPIDGGRGGYRVIIDGQSRGMWPSNGQQAAQEYYQQNQTTTPQQWQNQGGSMYGTTTYASGNQGTSSGGANTVNSGFADVARGLAGSNQMDLDERKRQFDEMYKIELRKLGLNERQIENQTQQFWASFGGQLLSTAAQLRGPGDWIKYQEYTSGGKDIFQALTGQTPIAAFGAPTGRSEPAGIMDLMRNLGIQFPQSVNLPSDWSGQITNWYNQYKSRNNGRAPSEQELKGVFKQITGFNDEIANKWYTQGVQWARQFGGGADQATQERWLGQWIPGLRIRQGTGSATTPTQTGSSGGAGGGGSAADNAYLDYIWGRRTDLENHYRSNGWDVSTPEGKRAAVRNWLTYEGNRGKTAEQVARELGYSGQATGTAAAGAGTGAANVSAQPTPQQTQPASANAGPGLSRPAGSHPSLQRAIGIDNNGNPIYPRPNAMDNNGQPIYVPQIGRITDRGRRWDAGVASAGTGVQSLMNTPTPAAGAQGVQGVQSASAPAVGVQQVTTPGQPAPSPGTGSIWQRLPQGWSMQIADWYKQEMARKGGVAPSANAVKAKFKEVTGYDDRMANKWYEMGTQYSRDYQRPADETQQIEWLKYWEPTFNAPRPIYTPGPARPVQPAQPAQPAQPTTPARTQRPQVPLPHQVNPAVWDSLSPTAQAMILASAEAGDTPSGAWDRGDYLRQLNAARPRGNAPRRVTTNWGRLGSQFS